MSEEDLNSDYGDFSYEQDAADSSGLYANELRQVLDAIDVSNSLTTPLKNAIDETLNLAAKAVGSEVETSRATRPPIQVRRESMEMKEA